MKRRSAITWVFLITLLCGCVTEFGSIQSSQLTFLRDRLVGYTDKGPQPAWKIHWLGEERPVYAVNAGNQVLFANESGDFVRFQDNQIIEVRNLLPGERHVLIEPSGAALHYWVNGSSIGVHTCHRWELERAQKQSDGASFVQSCSNDDMTYKNRFAINRDRKLVQLMYYVHPQYPPVRLELVEE